MNGKIKRLLRSEKGEASYISCFFFIFITVILITFIINIFHIISVKQELDHCADQLAKQIQLTGGTNGETDSLFSFLTSQMSEIGSPFYITVTGRCYLGGFWKFNLVPINIRAQGAGVSEHYWK